MNRVGIKPRVLLNISPKLKREAAYFDNLIDPFEDFFRVAIVKPWSIGKGMTSIEKRSTSTAEMAFLLPELDVPAVFLKQVGDGCSCESAAEYGSLQYFT